MTPPPPPADVDLTSLLLTLALSFAFYPALTVVMYDPLLLSSSAVRDRRRTTLRDLLRLHLSLILAAFVALPLWMHCAIDDNYDDDDDKANGHHDDADADRPYYSSLFHRSRIRDRFVGDKCRRPAAFAALLCIFGMCWNVALTYLGDYYSDWTHQWGLRGLLASTPGERKEGDGWMAVGGGEASASSSSQGAMIGGG